MKVRYAIGVCFSLFLAGACVAEEVVAVAVSDAWVREPMPGRNITAGYLTLTNHSEQEKILVAAHTDAAGRTEIHSHTMVDGMMRMRKEEQVSVPAGGSLVLEPGGYHLMLFALAEGLAAGDAVELELEFADGSRQLAVAAVRGMDHRQE